MNTIMRKSMLSVAGLAFAGGVFAGPIAAHANPGRHQAGRGAVQADKPDKQADPARHAGRPVPHHPERRADRQRQGDHRRDEEGGPARAGRGDLHRDEPAGVEAGEPGPPRRHERPRLAGPVPAAPVPGWGTPEQITDPEYSTTAFLKGLKQVDGWQDMPLTKAAQTVQVSAYPDAYAQWEQQAADLVAQHWNS